MNLKEMLNATDKELKERLLEISGKLKNREGTNGDLVKIYLEQCDILFELNGREGKEKWLNQHGKES